jgi:hypothetical protein
MRIAAAIITVLTVLFMLLLWDTAPNHKERAVADPGDTTTAGPAELILREAVWYKTSSFTECSRTKVELVAPTAEEEEDDSPPNILAKPGSLLPGIFGGMSRIFGLAAENLIYFVEFFFSKMEFLTAAWTEDLALILMLLMVNLFINL